MLNQISIVGAGRIGRTFAKIADSQDIDVVLLSRGARHLLTSGPIVVCTRNDDLKGVLEWIPVERRPDLIFIQNGMLQTWFVEQSLEQVTQALLYIAVANIGDEPVDGLRSVVTGPQSAAFVWLMNALELHCTEVSKPRYLLEMLEKLLWNCVFGLLCQVHTVPVGKVVELYKTQVELLTAELLEIGCSQLNLGNPSPVERQALVERLCDYSKSIPNYTGAVKEWDWRNGWFWDRQQDPNSVHATLLVKAGMNL